MNGVMVYKIFTKRIKSAYIKPLLECFKKIWISEQKSLDASFFLSEELIIELINVTNQVLC